MPDTSGYTSATIEVKQSVAAAGDVVHAELLATSATFTTASAMMSVTASAETFRQAWNKVGTALDAMVRYAESIEAIVDAGNSGSESAQGVADSVSTLAGSLGLALGPALGAATATFTFASGEIAKIRGARSLDGALAAAGPAIVQLQLLVRAQIGEARTTFTTALTAQEFSLRAEYSDYLGQDDLLLMAEKAQLTRLTDLVSGMGGLAEIAAMNARLKTITDARAALSPHLAGYNAKMLGIQNRRKVGLAVLGAADTAVAAWGTAHESLVDAVRERRPVTMASLTAAVTDVRAVIQKWREL